ncbi:hypothetical protein [Arthrobacter globiformis]|uniref:hypothetical protein n=1 Tax=Arthrobacter globiformis TaxID=1665 RepID=UPI002790F81A|nr:hypothetical protein [Arthrobacter globiformis]MDQ0618771.1 hypothetical protein [Arthrobacter globiformis]
MENSAAAVEALEAISASAAALAAELRRTDDAGLAGVDPLPDQPDPLQERADAFLAGVAEAARLVARLAAAKVHLAAGFAAAEAAMVPPDASVRVEGGAEGPAAVPFPQFPFRQAPSRPMSCQPVVSGPVRCQPAVSGR